MNYNGTNAKGAYRNRRVTLLEGSLIREEVLPSLADIYRDLRQVSSMTDGTLVSSDQSHLLRLARPKQFNSPSGAAQFVAGCSVSGNREWRLIGSDETLGIGSEDSDQSSEGRLTTLGRTCFSVFM